MSIWRFRRSVNRVAACLILHGSGIASIEPNSYHFRPAPTRELCSVFGIWNTRFVAFGMPNRQLLDGSGGTFDSNCTTTSLSLGRASGYRERLPKADHASTTVHCPLQISVLGISA